MSPAFIPRATDTRGSSAIELTRTAGPGRSRSRSARSPGAWPNGTPGSGGLVGSLDERECLEVVLARRLCGMPRPDAFQHVAVRMEKRLLRNVPRTARPGK